MGRNACWYCNEYTQYVWLLEGFPFQKDNNQKKTMSPLRQYDTPYSNGDIGLSHCKASKGTFNGNTVVVASKKEGKTMNTLQSKKKKIAALFAVISIFLFLFFHYASDNNSEEE